jgi:hypothetical protein
MRPEFAREPGRGERNLEARRQDAKSPHLNPPPNADRSPGIGRPKVPAETPYLASCRKFRVCKSWVVETVGLKLGTYHPVTEPVSACTGNGNFLRRDRPAKAGSSPGRDKFRDAREARKPPIPADELRDCLRSFEPYDWVVGAPGLEPGTR